MLGHVGRALGDEADLLVGPEHELGVERDHPRAEMGRRQEMLLDLRQLFRGPDFEALGRLRAVPLHLTGNIVDDEPTEAVGHDQGQAVISKRTGGFVHPLASAGGRHQFLAIIVVSLVSDQFH